MQIKKKRKSYQLRGLFDQLGHPRDHVSNAEIGGLMGFLAEHTDEAQKHTRESWCPSQHCTGSNSIICVTLSSAASHYEVIVEMNGLK